MDAVTYFYKGGLNCAETTLRCLIEEQVIDAPPETVRMMTGFGGGMQRGTTCGAVVGAVAALGWVAGRTESEQDREPSAKVVRTFLQEFENSFGTLNCRELQAAYVKEHALKSEGMYRSCTVFVERAMELVRVILAQTNTAESINRGLTWETGQPPA